MNDQCGLCASTEHARVNCPKLANASPLEKEANGICPQTDMAFYECLRGPCDCFLTLDSLGAYRTAMYQEWKRQQTGRITEPLFYDKPIAPVREGPSDELD